MPARRFWAMEAQITRLQAEADLRAIEVQRALNNKEAMQGVVNRLTREIGETVRLHRPLIVKPEPGAREKLLKAMG